MIQRLCFIVIFGLVFLFPADQGSAYILPTSFILAQTNTKLARLSTIYAKFTTSLWEKDLETAKGKEVLQIKKGGFFRSDLLIRKKTILKISNGNIMYTNESGEYKKTVRYNPLLELFGRSDLTQFLRIIGVNLTHRRYARFDDRIAVVIGTEDNTLSAPQIWIDQETHMPLRLVLNTGEGLIDLQLLKYHPEITNGLFPTMIQYFVNQQRVRSSLLDQVTYNQALDNSLFAISE